MRQLVRCWWAYSGLGCVIFLVKGMCFFLSQVLRQLSFLEQRARFLLASLCLLGCFGLAMELIKMFPVLGLMFAVMTVLSFVAYHYSETIQAGVTLFSNYMTSHSRAIRYVRWLRLLMSGRDMRLEAFLPTLENDLSVLFLIGGKPIAYGSMEIDPIDAFLRGGGLFFILLLVCYWKIFRFSGGGGGKSYKLVLFIVWMGIAFTGGHLWMASTTAPMLIIALAYASRMNVFKKSGISGGRIRAFSFKSMIKVIVMGTDPSSNHGGSQFCPARLFGCSGKIRIAF